MRKTKITNYIRGRNFEYRVKKLLEKKGYIVFRTAGSHGLFDLIGIKNYGSFFLFGFWQLKKNITDKQAKKYLYEILSELEIPINDFVVSNPHFINEKSKTKEICCYLRNPEFSVSFGIIYISSKRKAKNG